MKPEMNEPAAPSGEQPLNEAFHLELREERAMVVKSRVPNGFVTVRRELESRVEQVEVELVTETLIITHKATEETGEAVSVVINGQPLEPNSEIRVVIYSEAAEVRKRAVVIEDVEVRVVEAQTTETLPVELQRERLSVEKTGTATVHEVR
jgi:uncharacterized protein (TIGR02271 family)